MTLELILPWPPSVNHYKKVGRITKTKAGKVYQQRVNSKETMTYFYNVYIESKAQMNPKWAVIAQAPDVFFNVVVDLHPPNKRRYDVDNCLKVLLDSIVRAKVIYDDSQITRLLVQKAHNVEDGQVIVQLSADGEDPYA